LLLLASGSFLALRGASAALVPAVLLGVAWSLVHPTLQEAASRAWPGRRTYVMAGFVTVLFLGSAAGSELFPRILDAYGDTGVAVLCAVSTLLLPTMGPLLRRLDDALPRR
jgi:predicted MFS family arabinose efflux permease